MMQRGNLCVDCRKLITGIYYPKNGGKQCHSCWKKEKSSAQCPAPPTDNKNAGDSEDTCPICKGQGAFLCVQNDPSSQVECEECDGTGKVSKQNREGEVKKCPKCQHDRDKFDSKDNGMTLTNDRGEDWNDHYDYCRTCKYNSGNQEDNFLADIEDADVTYEKEVM